MAKKLFECDSGARTYKEITRDFQGGPHLVMWALKSRGFALSRVSQGDAMEDREERGGVNGSVKGCCWLLSWRKGAMSQGMQLVSSTREWAPAGSQLGYRHLSPPAARECILTTIWARGPSLPQSFRKGAQLWCHLEFSQERPETDFRTMVLKNNIQ